jgi:hypothetical protein
MNSLDRVRLYFNRGQKVFWGLLVLVLVLTFLHLSDRLFDGKAIPHYFVQLEKEDKEGLIVKKDTTTFSPKDSVGFTWKWTDYNEQSQEISFKLAKEDFKKCEYNRLEFPLLSSLIWGYLYEFDAPRLGSLIHSYKKSILGLGLKGQEALDYVVSSIQFTGYTYVCLGMDDSRCGIGRAPAENCVPLGCCDNVKPYAVFSPFEFAYNKTGDCDTKALFAFTILKGLGYDNVSVIHGATEGGGHAMLGVKVPNPPVIGQYIHDRDGQKIYAWETTAGAYRLGESFLPNLDNWTIGLN